MQKGKLYLLPSSLGNDAVSRILPAFNTEVLNSITHFIAEDARTARRFIRDAGYIHSLDAITFYLLNKHTATEDIPSFLDEINNGKDIGLLSEAGCPCIADPGALVVEAAHAKNIDVIPLVGPSSILLALMASGFNGQHFVFNGYLPIDQQAKISMIKKMEQRVYAEHQTQIFIETPYRNDKLLQDLLNTCKPQTQLCIAKNITLPTEFIKTRSVQEWKKHKLDLNKMPVVFLLYK